MSIKGGIQKQPITQTNHHFQDDFKKAYATAINNICSRWIHNDVNGCDSKEVQSFGEILMIYQPGKITGTHVDTGHVLFIFNSRVSPRSVRGIVEEFEKMLEEDYQQMKQDCDGKWFRECEDNFQSILAVKKPMDEYRSNTWKISFEPANQEWIPRRIQEFLGEFDDEEYEIKCKRIKN